MIGRSIRVLGVALLLTMAATGIWRRGALWPLRVRAASSTDAAPPGIEVTRVQRGAFRLSVTATGKLRAHKTASVRTDQLDGKLVSIAQDGAPIKKGDLLAKLDEQDWQRQVRDIGLEYANAQADMEKSIRDRALEERNSQVAVDKANEEMRILRESNQVQIKQAQQEVDYRNAELERLTTDYERKKRQQEEKLIPLEQLELADIARKSAAFDADKAQKDLKLQIEKANSAVKEKETDIENAGFTVLTSQRKAKDDATSAKAKLANIKSRLDDAKQRLGWCTILAPASGLVVLAKSWHFPDGQRVSRPGDEMRPYSPVADIPDLSQMAIDCKIPEKEIGAIHLGQPVIVRLDERPNHPYHARITGTGSVAEEVSPWDDSGLEPGTKTFTVTMEIQERDPKHLLPGMSASMEVVTRTIPNAISVPKSCVFDRGTDHVVYVRHGHQFEPAVVEPGEENSTQVRIRRGLHGGEWIATSDPTRVVTEAEQ